MTDHQAVKTINSGAKVVLFDIEGTTTAITFVTKTLFPYAKAHLEDYLRDNWGKEEINKVVGELVDQSVEDKKRFGDDVPQICTTTTRSTKEKVILSVCKYVLWQMANNQKTTALKKLQGFIWRDGYHSGKIVGHVYDDVKPALEKLREAQKKLFIYSSGSVEAQKLLFEHTGCGNLLPLFDGHFDTEIGDKKNASSYKKIAECINHKTEEVLFLTDIEQEATAAINAGMNACIVVRPGNKSIDNLTVYSNICDFGELF